MDGDGCLCIARDPTDNPAAGAKSPSYKPTSHMAMNF